MTDQDIANAVIAKYGYLVFAWDCEPKRPGDIIPCEEVRGAQCLGQPFLVSRRNHAG
jgi:hypothetical protein